MKQKIIIELFITLIPAIFMPHTKFEKARIIGARALQISMGAPVIIDIPRNVIDPVDIALMEYENDVIPITVRNN